MPVAVILKYSSIASARNLTEGEKKKLTKKPPLTLTKVAL